jgi:hypothetical protein
MDFSQASYVGFSTGRRSPAAAYENDLKRICKVKHEHRGVPHRQWRLRHKPIDAPRA